MNFSDKIQSQIGSVQGTLFSDLGRSLSIFGFEILHKIFYHFDSSVAFQHKVAWLLQNINMLLLPRRSIHSDEAFFLAKFPTGTSERTLSLLTYSLLPLQHFRNRRRNSLGPLHHCLLTLPFSRGGSDQLRRALKLQIASWSSCGKYISERKMKLLMAKHHPKTWEADRQWIWQTIL